MERTKGLRKLGSIFHPMFLGVLLWATVFSSHSYNVCEMLCRKLAGEGRFVYVTQIAGY
jgi:hypothetical protein